LHLPARDQPGTEKAAVIMRTIYADYNAMTEAGHICLTTRGSQEDIRAQRLQSGDWAWLSDSEVVVGAQLAIDDHYGLVGVPDWDTIVHLDDDDARDFKTVQSELRTLFQRPSRVPDEGRRILQLLTISDFLAPPEVKVALSPGYLSSRRGEILLLLGKPELALTEFEEARRLDPGDPQNHFFLEALRIVDLPRARDQAEILAARPDVTADALAACINVLATYADDLPDDEFGAVAERILRWADQFERAPGRERVPAFTLAVIQFNRGIALLRLGRGEAARDALRLAWAVDPIFSEIEEATRLTVYDQYARDLAARVRGRAVAA
jgi:tetratricopeptide (TPR) repeat protein